MNVFNLLSHPGAALSSPLFLVLGIFQLWMLIDAGRRQEWMWFFIMLIFPGLGTLWYFFYVYRGSVSTATSGFELPGAFDRRRIKELEAQIHHLDKAYHHSQLGDIYFQQGKLAPAETCYRAALERDAEDLDTRAHLGQCLLRLNRPAEARPLLEGVVAENPKHDYGHTQMALAETLTALGDTEAAITIWQRVMQSHTYPRARVQLAEIYLGRQQPELARPVLQEVVADEAYTLPFQRKRDRVWVRRAKKLLRQL